jgi:pyruvate, water dikinase
MAAAQTPPSTGLPELDSVLGGLRLGDNVVWQVGSIEEYLPFAKLYFQQAHRQGRKLVYFHFERHDELIPPGVDAETHRLDPGDGFETLTAEIHRIITRTGPGAFYLFDCLSDLAADWYSDLMVGNFFKVTCPYLRELDTIAYFALLRRCHSYRTVATIRDTTQLLLDVHRHEGQLYVHPLKVFERYSPTMYLPHVWQGDSLHPVTDSAAISGIYATISREGRGPEADRFDLWDRTFQEAQDTMEAIRRGERGPEEATETLRRLLAMLIGRTGRMTDLAEKYLTMDDLLAVRRRMIGTGLVGGKAVGMLLARSILRSADQRWQQILEPHDSYFVGSDVFYSYLVSNGCWKLRQRQRDALHFLEDAERTQEQIRKGVFPDFVREQFVDMLDYFGQSPIVVRSSSLLEDSFGNAFSGKYESVFCANQGSPQERLDEFLAAVRRVYASAMGQEALLYRSERGLLDRDEQMALLVQRVSGSMHGSMYFPHVAGVGLSYNPYVWSEQIDPEAGMLRLVFGLGTRAVRRADDDYTRIVALNAPNRRPETTSDEVRGYAQWRVDVLDLQQRMHRVCPFQEVVEFCGTEAIRMVAWRDPETMRRSRETRRPAFPWVLTFGKLLAETAFVDDMRGMLKTLEAAYDYPVDTEFTANFLPDGSYRINLVQCRPFQAKGGGHVVPALPDVPESSVLLRSQGAVIGSSQVTNIGRLIYVVPSVYGGLPLNDRYTVARLIGRLTRSSRPGHGGTLLVGPGRWGTTEPSLGVPVSFSEINRVAALCEVMEMREGLVPDVSLGTHFFNDLVEMQILYLALVPGKPGNQMGKDLIESVPNRLAAVLPGESRWSDVIRVIEPESMSAGNAIELRADALRQTAICYFAQRAV